MNLGITLFVAWGVIFYLGLSLYHRIIEPKEDKWYHNLFFIIWISTAIIPFAIHQNFIKDIEYEEEEHEWYIKSLGNDKYVKGKFFLGSGSVQEKDYYFFYVNTSKGYQRLKILVSETYIIETDKRAPEYVKVYSKYNDEGIFWKVLFHDEKFNRLYVPKNTIIRDFKVR
ncbi:hypothetical protein [Tenacibaculum finnmarkense]|uniref:hypothetical protein n=1 Tax=Tenacibaculum finnmarkense TaxID=2781243 RepID=UPI001EFACB12|nr:hypothetical protein [Tenacibaculum finnmarkense]MCG8750498.1 hypothetical protein [Tenacibaculum finnmarkense]MCG8755532.1 hypothetical protein [Tenacibaculum finnmarkense]MCG8784080.1 hypothetical protein [Tenacibaculum finnmarkense]